MNPFFSTFFKKKQGADHIIGIDVGVSAIKVVELRRENDRIALGTYGSIALGPYAGTFVGGATQLSASKIAEALTDLLREAKTTTKKAGIAIPFSGSLVSVITVPDVPDKQLNQMIPIEARKHIPVPISEVQLDWSVIPQSGSQPKGKKEVVLVAIHNEVLHKGQAIVEKSLVEPLFFEIEIFSSLRSVTDNSPEPFLIIDFGSSSTKLYIFERGTLRFTHKINRGGQDLTQAIVRVDKLSPEDAEVAKREFGIEQTNSTTKEAILFTVDHIVAEIRNALRSYQSRSKKNVGKIILLGGGAVLKGLEEYVRNTFEQDVVRGNPFSHVQAPAFLTDTLYDIGPEFAVALGLAKRGLIGGE